MRHGLFLICFCNHNTLCAVCLKLAKFEALTLDARRRDATRDVQTQMEPFVANGMSTLETSKTKGIARNFANLRARFQCGLNFKKLPWGSSLVKILEGLLQAHSFVLSLTANCS